MAVVVNQTSGSSRLARRALRALRRQPVDIVGVWHTEGRGLAETLQRAVTLLHPDGVLAVAGGDGTVGCAARTVSTAGGILGILPTGTGNDVARSLRIPLNPEEAAALIAHGDASAMDLGAAPDATFAHAATVGMTADFADRVRDVKGWRRPVVYPIRAWEAWRARQPLAIEIRVDGKSVASPTRPFQVAVVNAPRLGGRIGVTLPGASVDDGRLEVIVVDRRSFREAARTLTGLLRSRPSPAVPGATIRAGHVVEILSQTPLTVALDGEPMAETPFQAKAWTNACAVLTPVPARRTAPKRVRGHH